MGAGQVTTPLSPGAPIFETQESEDQRQQLIGDLFEAAAQGNTQQVLVLVTALGLEWTSYDIERFTELAKWYGKLETNGDALTSLLSTHKEGHIEINEDMRLFINEAVLQMTKAGKAPTPEMQAIINKVLNGQEISEEEAKSLYSWLLGAKESVVPTPYRITSISQTIKQLQDQYEQYLQSGGRWISAL